MSSGGQIVGGIVGGIVGFFAGGNVALGASIGMAIGGYIDPPKGPKGRPPSASDLAVQTATYGAPLSRGYGTYGTLGNVFWVEGNSLRAEEVEAEGGKGGAPAGPSTYAIYGTFAVGFGEGEIDGYGRIWCSGKLVADYSASSLTGVIATSENAGTITLYTGSASQLPDDRIQADMGAANTPAYRGLHYLVFKDWPMADYGNTLMGMQVKAEIVRNGSIVPSSAVFSHSPTPPAPLLYVRSFRLSAYGIIETGSTAQSSGYDMVSIRHLYHVFGASNPVLESDVPIDAYHDGFFHNKHQIYLDQTDTDCIVMSFYLNTDTQVIVLDRFGGVLSDSGRMLEADIPASLGRAVVDRGEIFFGDHGQKLYKIPLGVYHDYTVPVISSPTALYAEHFGVSENYVFVVDNSTGSGSNCTVLKLDRATLSTVATYTQAIDGTTAIICVISDTEFYTLPSNSGAAPIFRWINGVASDTGMRYSATRDVNARLMVASPTLAYVVKDTVAWEIYACWAGNQGATVPLADIISAECQLSRLLTPADIDVTDIDEDVRGYKISNTAAIRSSLEPLQVAWPFDVITHGYKIKFVRRGKTPVATIDTGELGCVAGNEKPGVMITASREMDTQLPRKVTIKYLDVGREYDLNVGPGAERLSTDAINVEEIELAIVMNADEAAQKEEVTLYMRWLDRHDVSCVLPPPNLNLEAADVITISGNGATYELRLTSINYLPDGRLECQAKFNNAAVYTSTAVGQAGLDTGQVLSIAGPSKTLLLDIPCVDSTLMNRPALLAGMSGYTSGWPGGTLVRSDDNGQTWASIQGFSAPQMTSGMAAHALASGVTHIVDASNKLVVWVAQGIPSSVSELAMFNGANHFAVGAHGRWEIIAARTVVDNADGTYTLSDMMRGRFGTEWAMGLHSANDQVVLLDYAALRLIDMSVADINMERLWRGVTYGKTLDSTPDIRLDYAGANLECLAPVYLNGSRTYPAGDWTITCTMRSRLAVEPFSGIATPSGETVESWELEIWNSAFSTLKRTISGLSAPSAAYSSADQITDWGFNQDTLYVRWYRLSPLVGRGYPLQGTITRLFRSSGANYSQAILALNPLLYYKMDGNTTTFADSSTTGNTATGSASGITYQQPSLLSGATPGYSIATTAAGYVSSPRLAAMDGAYTAIVIFKCSSLAASSVLFHKGDNGIGGQQGHHIYIEATTGKLRVRHFNGSWSDLGTWNAITAVNEKVWMAVVYDGATSFKVYKNGAFVQEITLPNAFVSNTQPLSISGVRTSGAVGGGMAGNHDEFVWFNYQLTGGQLAALFEES